VLQILTIYIFVVHMMHISYLFRGAYVVNYSASDVYYIFTTCVLRKYIHFSHSVGFSSFIHFCRILAVCPSDP